MAALESGEPAGDFTFEVSEVRTSPGAAPGELRATIRVAGLRALDPTRDPAASRWIVTIASRDEKGAFSSRQSEVPGDSATLAVELRLPDSTAALGIAIEEISTGSWGARPVRFRPLR